MSFQVSPVPFETIKPFRDLYRNELNCQIIHDSAHYREKCFQSYLIKSGSEIAGYGSVWIGDYWMAKGSIFEFYLLPDYHPSLFTLFEYFFHELDPPRIYAQTNDPFLGILIFDYVQEVTTEHILFSDGFRTNCTIRDVKFRRLRSDEKDNAFKHHTEPVGEWALEISERVVATGGILFHYNRPYGDIFMEMDDEFRRQGLGRFLVQELKGVCYQSGSIPAARCKPTNTASRKTLEGAGFVPCGRLIYGNTATSKNKNKKS